MEGGDFRKQTVLDLRGMGESSANGVRPEGTKDISEHRLRPTTGESTTPTVRKEREGGSLKSKGGDVEGV